MQRIARNESQGMIHVKATPAACPQRAVEDVTLLKKCGMVPKKILFRTNCGAETVEIGQVACIAGAARTT